MSLRIGQFNTTCHVPERHRAKTELVDGMARGRLARDLGEHLGPSLSRQPAIVRIRRLPLRVIVSASDFSEDALAFAWKQAFAKALFTALAYPTDTGPVEVFRAESAASFIALAVRDLLAGAAAFKWQYAEFEKFFRLGDTQAALALICEWPLQTLPVLLELARHDVLGCLLARFDDTGLERLFSVLARPPDSVTEPLAIGDLVSVARLALEGLPEKSVMLRSRGYALILFVKAGRTGQPVQSPRTFFHALLAIAVLLNAEVFWPGAANWPAAAALPGVDTWPDVTALQGMLSRLAVPAWAEVLHAEPLATHLPSNVAALLESVSKELGRQWQASRSNGSPGVSLRSAQSPSSIANRESHFLEGQLAELNRLLLSLGAQLKVPSPLPPSPEIRWIRSDWCGLFFLLGTLARLGWLRAWGKLAVFQTGGVSCLAAGLAMALVESFDPAVPALDPGIALFAGYLGDPDIAHLRRVFQQFPREVRGEVWRAALPQDTGEDAAESWQGLFDRLAGLLLRDFGSRIRGFRQATRPNLVRTFIARPGRIRITPDRIVVYPSPSPFHVALHISGADEAIEPSLWLGGRRIEFELGDL